MKQFLGLKEFGGIEASQQPWTVGNQFGVQIQFSAKAGFGFPRCNHEVALDMEGLLPRLGWRAAAALPGHRFAGVHGNLGVGAGFVDLRGHGHRIRGGWRDDGAACDQGCSGASRRGRKNVEVVIPEILHSRKSRCFEVLIGFADLLVDVDGMGAQVMGIAFHAQRSGRQVEGGRGMSGGEGVVAQEGNQRAIQLRGAPGLDALGPDVSSNLCGCGSRRRRDQESDNDDEQGELVVGFQIRYTPL